MTDKAVFPKKRTMIKDRVGCVKSTVYDLPSADHIYGMKRPSDPEGAGRLISHWVTANPSAHKEANKQMIVYSNVLAVKKGCITARAMRQYAIEHPNIRLKELLHVEDGRLENKYEGPFGIKTQFAEESMDQLIQAKYTSFSSDDVDYPNVSSITKKGAAPKPKSTIAADSISLAREKKLEKNHNDSRKFTLKKFQNVEGKALRRVFGESSYSHSPGAKSSGTTSQEEEESYNVNATHGGGGGGGPEDDHHY